MCKNKVLVRVSIAICIALSPSLTLANTTYNFHFEKDKKSTGIDEVKKNEPSVITDKTTNSDVTYFVEKEPSTHGKIQTKIPKVKALKELHWEIAHGLAVTNGDNYYQGAYSLGGRYFFNKYLHLGAELLIPSGGSNSYGYVENNYIENGDYVTTGYGSQEGSPKTNGSLGVGVTPIHIKAFGREIIDFGFDGGVMFGSRPSTAGMKDSNTSLYLGGRLGFLFTHRVSFAITTKVDLNYDNFYSSSINMAYRW